MALKLHCVPTIVIWAGQVSAGMPKSVHACKATGPSYFVLRVLSCPEGHCRAAWPALHVQGLVCSLTCFMLRRLSDITADIVSDKQRQVPCNVQSVV